MPWITARTWVSGETVTAAIMNAHVRDQLNLLKTNIDDDGVHKLNQFALQGSAGNVSSGETDLTGFTWTIPANFIDDGESLIVEGRFDLAANANNKALRFYIGATGVLFYTAAGNNLLGHFRMAITRLTTTTAHVNGITTLGTSGLSAVSTHISQITGISSLDWTVAQVAKFTGQATSNNDILLRDLWVTHFRGNAS